MNRRFRHVLAIAIALSLVAACSSDDDSTGGGLGQLLGTATSGPGTTDLGEELDGDEPDGPLGIVWEGDRGTLEVPLDHDDPDGDTIELALTRRPANDPDNSLGPLLVN